MRIVCASEFLIGTIQNDILKVFDVPEVDELVPWTQRVNLKIVC